MVECCVLVWFICRLFLLINKFSKFVLGLNWSEGNIFKKSLILFWLIVSVLNLDFIFDVG